MRLESRFRVLRPIQSAEGRETLLAQDRLLGVACVLKLAAAGGPAGLHLRQEGQRLGALSHPRLVRLHAHLHGLEREGGAQLLEGFATAWVDGQPLEQALKGAPLGEVWGALAQLLSVVDHLHGNGILHLDIKDDNALYGSGGLTLLDLGSAQPTDVGAGLSGGTLGYAAPEVVAGEAASVASDLYSVGVLFFRLLTGELPREARLSGLALGGEALPLRALRPDVPPAMAELLESMISWEPGRRPADVRSVRARLAELGWGDRRQVGAPPRVGADDPLHRLVQRLSPPGALVAVVGPTWSGRRRMVAEALGRLADRGLQTLDLSEREDPIPALSALIALLGGALPQSPAPEAWAAEALAATGDLPMGCPWVLSLGDSARFSPRIRQAVLVVLGALRALGLRVVEVAAEAERAAVALAPPRVGAADLLPLAHFYGVPAEAATEAFRRSGGRVGLLVALLRGGQPRAAPSPGARALLDLLQALPAGSPRALVQALADAQPALQVGLHELLEASLAWWGPDDGALYVLGGAGRAALPEWAVGPLTTWLKAPSPSTPALWQALTALRLGAVDRAEALLPAALDADNGLVERMELAEALCRRGSPAARRALAEMRRQIGDHVGVVGILEDATDRDGAEDRLLARALRSLGRLDAAEALARDAALHRADPALWLELARCRLARADLDGAEAACADAAVLAAGPSAEVLNLRMVIAIHRGPAGAPAQVAVLFKELKGLRALDRVDSAVLGSAARLLELQGQTEESLQLQAEAAQRADLEGDTERAAGLRLNLGLGLERAGRIGDARLRYQEALHLADGAGLHALCQRIHSSWASLELAAGRLPDAENHLRAFERLVPIVGGSGTEDRLWVLRAELAAALGRPAEALAHLAQVSLARLPPRNARHVGLLLAELKLGVGELEAAADSLDALGPLEDPIDLARALALRGRLAMAQGRALLREAVAALPTEPSPTQRKAAGEVLLASGGEDIAPAEITRRREQLDLASRWLRGPAAGRAAALRDLLQLAPGASLDDIVALTESMADPQAFPAAIASLVREALGAHRVLIMLRMPGLGKVTWTELSGAEATGICAEVLKRIQRPERVWLAANAFEDLELRESSQTVRTFELKSLLAVAVSQGEEAIGAIYVDDKHRADRFGEAETQLLQRLGRAVGGLLPVVGAVERLPVAFAEPVDILGVRTSDRHHVDILRATLGAMGDRHRRGHQVNLLLTGPTGAGKSVLVERLAQEVFGIDEVERVVLHNGDPQMLVATLAGARKGEYTGAADSVGAIQRAIKHRRVLFLDELQNLEDAGQQVLLPLLELPIRRFGGLTRSTLPIGGELHVILGTNAPVALGAWEEVFREDLWYRMSTLHLDLPPLHERGVEAVYRYLVDFLAEWGAPPPEEVFTTPTLRQLTAWSWPGNLRQLRAFADRSAQLWLMRQSPLLEGDVARLLPEAMNPPTVSRVQRAAEVPAPTLAPEIWSALQRQHFVQKLAARDLGISPSHLNKLLRRAGLQERVKDLRTRRRKRNGD